MREKRVYKNKLFFFSDKFSLPLNFERESSPLFYLFSKKESKTKEKKGKQKKIKKKEKKRKRKKRENFKNFDKEIQTFFLDLEEKTRKEISRTNKLKFCFLLLFFY